MASLRRPCGCLVVPRFSLSVPSRAERALVLDELPAARIQRLICAYPTSGNGRIWALLWFREGLRASRKAVYRELRLKGWFIHQRRVTLRLRMRKLPSRPERSNQRWAVDMSHVPCGPDRWGHLAAVIAATTASAPAGNSPFHAERALEEARIRRFGILRPAGETPVVRSEDGLIIQSRRFRPACRDYRLRQEFITPYTPEQNGMIERFYRSLEEKCAWQHDFVGFREAKAAIAK